MKFKSIKLLAIFPLMLLLLSGCETLKVGKKTKKVFKHNTPLIKQDVKALGKKELEKSAEWDHTNRRRCKKIKKEKTNILS